MLPVVARSERALSKPTCPPGKVMEELTYRLPTCRVQVSNDMLSTLVNVCAHSRFVCPAPRSQDTGIKNGPCGSNFDDFMGPVMTLEPGPLTIEFEESVAHTGAPWRVSLSADGDDSVSKECILLDHIPHDDNSSPAYENEATYHKFRITVNIPDVDCAACSLHLANPMTDKIGAAGKPTAEGCTEPGTCFSVYYSCTTPLRITGSVPRALYSCPSSPPLDWPQQWTSPDTGRIVNTSDSHVYRRESATWVDGWLMDAPSSFRDSSAICDLTTVGDPLPRSPLPPPGSPPPPMPPIPMPPAPEIGAGIVAAVVIAGCAAVLLSALVAHLIIRKRRGSHVVGKSNGKARTSSRSTFAEFETDVHTTPQTPEPSRS